MNTDGNLYALEHRIKELEAALEKAVEAIDRALWEMDIGYDLSAFHLLKTALAELKEGEKQ